jgi:hypothetical protein
MRSAAWLLVLAAGLGPGCAVQPDPQAHADPGTMHFFMRADLPLARAQINGVDVGFMLLDTGSSITVLAKDLADRLHLARQGKMPVTGIGGTTTADICSVSDLRVGGQSLGAHAATVIDLAPLSRNIGWPVAGIVGFDTIRDQAFTIDFEAGTITFESAESRGFADSTPGATASANPGVQPPPGAAVLELRTIGGLPAVPGRIASHPNAWLQIDTGSDGSLALSLAAVRQCPDLLSSHANSAGEATGVGGVGNLIQSTLVTVGVFGVNLSDVSMQVELPDRQGLSPTQFGDRSGGTLLVGRLGNQVLRRFRITFDLPHHRLWAVVRPGLAGR